METLLSADLDGMVPEAYNIAEITELRESRDSWDHARLDLAFTDGFLRYSHNISEGRSTDITISSGNLWPIFGQSKSGAGTTLHPGVSDPRLVQIRQLLVATRSSSTC